MSCLMGRYDALNNLVSALKNGNKKSQKSIEDLIRSNEGIRRNFWDDFKVADSETANIVYLNSDLF